MTIVITTFVAYWCLFMAMLFSVMICIQAAKGNVEPKYHIACACYYIAAFIAFKGF